MDIRKNNFDLLRLFAALQVVFGHSFSHLEIQSPILQSIGWFLSAFPGVPIFFMISGFLITASYERNHNIKQYTINRLIRIYPALWVTLILSTLIICSLGYLNIKNITDFLVWIFCQLTLFQFYNPSFLRGFGVGVVNGALWTITVELQFYILVPILYVILKKCVDYNRRAKFFWVIFIAAILINIICSQISGPENNGHHNDSPIWVKLLMVSILPYLYCFMMGVLFRLHLDEIRIFIVGKYKFISYLLAYLALYAFFRESIHFSVDSPLIMMVLALPIISFAFNFTHLSHFLLKGNDFSYGLYIYHMLVINVFVYLGLIGAWYLLAWVIMLSFIFAILSWKFVEQPILAFKYNPLRQVASSDEPLLAENHLLS